MEENVKNGLLSAGVVVHCTIRSTVGGRVHSLYKLTLNLTSEIAQHFMFACLYSTEKFSALNYVGKGE